MSRRDVAHLVRFDNRHFVYFPFIWLAKAVFDQNLSAAVANVDLSITNVKCTCKM